jgi:indole-3-glycerol phosphate synthase
LTEEDKFQGSLEDLKTARKAVEIPILRKDFIFDEFQIYEAAEAGADVILLIAAMLDDEVLRNLHRLAEEELGLDALSKFTRWKN